MQCRITTTGLVSSKENRYEKLWFVEIRYAKVKFENNWLYVISVIRILVLKNRSLSKQVFYASLILSCQSVSIRQENWEYIVKISYFLLNLTMGRKQKLFLEDKVYTVSKDLSSSSGTIYYRCQDRKCAGTVRVTTDNVIIHGKKGHTCAYTSFDNIASLLTSTLQIDLQVFLNM